MIIKNAKIFTMDDRRVIENGTVVIENGKISTCGRCIDVEGLCSECGYFFVAEYTLLFGGNIKIIFEMLRTYLKYI